MPGSRLVLVASLALALAAAPALAQDTGPPPAPEGSEVHRTPSGLEYVVLVEGDPGDRPRMDDKVTVHYTGWNTSGLVFDSSRKRGQPAEFRVGGLIKGWNEALQMMTVGARWRLTIPPELGYGSRGAGKDIPPNETLVFDMELLGLVQVPQFRKPDAKLQTTLESGVKYEVVTAGTGDFCRTGDAFEMHMTIWDPKGKVMHCTKRRGQAVKGTMQNTVAPFMKEALPLMNPGAIFLFEVLPDLAFKKRPPPLAEDDATYWRLELVRVMKPLPVPDFALPPDEELTTTRSGLEYKMIQQGDGESPTLMDEVTVHYAGWLTDGTLFDSSFSRGEPTSFPLRGVIRGWGEGLQLMNPGAIYLFVIPPELAYGPRQQGKYIKPNSTLVFRVEMISVKPGPVRRPRR